MLNEFARHAAAHRFARERDRDRAGAGRDTATREPTRENFSRVCQPAGERPFGNLQPQRRIRARNSFEVAQHDRGAVLIRQALQLLVDDAAQVRVVVPGFRRDGFGGGGHGMLHHPPSGGAGLQGGAIRHPVEPVRELFRPVDLARAAREHQERGLKRVLRVLRVAGHAPAHGKHHPSMPANELREGVLVARANESREQIAIGRVACSEDGPKQLTGKRAGGGLRRHGGSRALPDSVLGRRSHARRFFRVGSNSAIASIDESPWKNARRQERANGEGGQDLKESRSQGVE